MFTQPALTVIHAVVCVYSEARQATQDRILAGMMTTIVRDFTTNKYCTRPLRPWVVFTAGAMGSGKSWTMRWLQVSVERRGRGGGGGAGRRLDNGAAYELMASVWCSSTSFGQGG